MCNLEPNITTLYYLHPNAATYRLVRRCLRLNVLSRTVRCWQNVAVSIAHLTVGVSHGRPHKASGEATLTLQQNTPLTGVQILDRSGLLFRSKPTKSALHAGVCDPARPHRIAGVARSHCFLPLCNGRYRYTVPGSFRLTRPFCLFRFVQLSRLLSATPRRSIRPCFSSYFFKAW